LTDLRSAPVPPPGEGDHIAGASTAEPLIIEYADFECPFCAALSAELAGRPVRRVFRHFPVRSSHPRAWPAACAAEAAAMQDRFWEMHDLLFGDQGRLEDPHLWAYAERLELDLVAEQEVVHFPEAILHGRRLGGTRRRPGTRVR
jgi:protein-disulfide isomerase